jgi:hypothetical protein
MLALGVAAILPAVVVLLMVWHPVRDNLICRFLFCRWINGVVFGVAALCFLRKISTLGPADFGNHRQFLQIFLIFLAVAAILGNYGFLVVRGIVILQLLWASAVLNTFIDAYTWWALAVKVLTYAIILESLYLAIFPYRLRDRWLKHSRPIL